MANIKSAKKRILVTEKKTQHNKAIRSRVKTSIKRVEAAVASGDRAKADEELRLATSELARASKRGIYHKNNASRKVSRLSKAVNAMG